MKRNFPLKMDDLDGVLEFFSNGKISFPELDDGVTLGFVVRMKNCFSIMAFREEFLVLQLKKDAHFDDPMGYLRNCPVEGSGKAALMRCKYGNGCYAILCIISENDTWRLVGMNHY